MQKLLMKQTARGTQDGFHVELFKAGAERWVADQLACDFLNKGYAEVVANPGPKPTNVLNIRGQHAPERETA